MRAFPNPAADLGDSTTEQRWALLERVAASDQLKRAARLREFLLYVGTHAIEDRTDLHEQQIGSAVFGRPESYDTSQDNIVRVNATELRKRLELYFATDGVNEPLVFEIPRGKYTPVFRPREPSAIDLLLRETSAPAPIAQISPEASRSSAPPVEVVPAHPAEPVPLRATVGGGDRERQGWQLALARSLVAVFAIALVLLAWQNRKLDRRLHPWREGGALQSFWSNFLEGNRQTDIVLADTSFALTQDMTQQQISLSQYLDYQYKNTLSRVPQTADARDQQRRDLDMILARSIGSIGDFRVAQRFIDLQERSPAIQLRSAREYTALSLRQHSSILIGSTRSNPWVELFQDQLEYRVEFSPDTPDPVVRVRHPQGREQAEYRASADPATRIGYGVIAFLPNPSHEADSLILAGTDSQATEAAGEFLTSEADMSGLLKRLGRRSFPYFQLLLRTSRLNGTPLSSEIVAYRIGPN